MDESASAPPPRSAVANDVDDDGDDSFSNLSYQHGFGNTFESEVLQGALPRGRNNPRLVPFNLYTEQLSGTAFTAPRVENKRTWLYRIQPSVVCHLASDDIDETTTKATSRSDFFGQCDPKDCRPYTNPLRWKPLQPSPTETRPDDDFVSGMRLMMSAQDIAIYMYACNASMTQQQRQFCNTDGDLLIVPQSCALHITTELGKLRVSPQEICVIPRGIVFQVDLPPAGADAAAKNTAFARGYVLEINKGHFQLPELGPIGSNGLANARDFEYPIAWCVQDQVQYKQPSEILYKVSSKLYPRKIDHSPYNVVAWHGTYLPYKYNLTRFCAVNSVTYDHLDPSIYTVLTCQSDHAGTALADFVIFPHRIMATDSNTFRPPWFHRNCMSEFMGMICGEYDAKEGFEAGGASLHNCMTPHGPDSTTNTKAIADECLEPVAFQGGLAFMFETCMPLHISPLALDRKWRDVEYNQCWQDLTDNFTGWNLLGRGAAQDMLLGGGESEEIEASETRADF